MFRKNKDLLNKDSFVKGMISIPSITLTPEEADRFIDYMVEESVLKESARIERMKNQSKLIRAVGLGSDRITHPAENFSSSNYKKTLTHNKITLASKEIRSCIVVFDNDIEDNIEGQAFVDHIMRLVAIQINHEMEEAFWIGDQHDLSGFGTVAGGSEDTRCVWDGWRHRIAHAQLDDTYYNKVSGAPKILDASLTDDFDIAGKIAMCGKAAPYNWEFKYAKMLEELPSKYKKAGLNTLRFFQSDLVTQNYNDALAARSTILGDQALLGKGPTHFGQVPIVSVPLMPTTLAVATDPNYEKYSAAGAWADVLLTHMKNLIIGIQRDIKIETERQAADQATYFYYSMRADLAIENVNAIVLLKRLVTAGTMIET